MISSLQKQTVMLKPWQKFRIKIHSKPIRFIPIYSEICVRTNLREFIRVILEKVFNLVWCKSVENLSNSVRVNPN